MKVLITTDTYFPMINGVVISTSNLYKELKNKGHEVKIITLSHDGEERVEGDIYYLKSIKVNVYPDARIKVPFCNSLIKEVIDWKPEIIHSQTEFSTMVVAKSISKRLAIPHVHTYHTMYEDYLNYLLGGKLLNKSAAAKVTKILLNSLNGVVAPTDKTKTALRDYGVDVNIEIIPTGIDLNKFKKTVAEEEKNELLLKYGLKKDDKIMVYVGRVAEEKNIEEILELFPNTLERVPKVKFLIVGGGPYLDKLMKIVKDKNLEDNVVFTGMVKPEEVYKYYQIAHLFVTASTSETQGLTYIEALSSGCPIVCKYDKSVEGVVLQGRNGFLYKNPWEFTLFTSEILLDKDLRGELCERAKDKALEYSLGTFADNMLSLYRKSISCSYQTQGKRSTSSMVC